MKIAFAALLVHAGLRVPLEGEAAWITPEGTKAYWRGKITRLHYAVAT